MKYVSRVSNSYQFVDNDSDDSIFFQRSFPFTDQKGKPRAIVRKQHFAFVHPLIPDESDGKPNNATIQL